MKPCWIVAFSLLTGSWLSAANGPKTSAAALLDEAIQRPGDFSQVCDAGLPVPFDAPPIPAYGLAVTQQIFLSDEMKRHLKERRDEIVKELSGRLDKVDWVHPPPAPKLAKKPMFPPAHPISPDGEGDPTQPSGQNPRTLGPVMLTIIIELDAVEVLPQLLRLENSLHELNQAAAKGAEKAPLAAVDLGGFSQWKGMMDDFKGVEDWDKVPLKLKRKRQLFDGLVFDREILGTMLELLHRKHYAPLNDSTFGRTRAALLKAKAAEDDRLRTIKSPEDVAKVSDKDGDKPYIAFDRDLGIPYWRWEHASLDYSEALREEARKLVETYLESTKAVK